MQIPCVDHIMTVTERTKMLSTHFCDDDDDSLKVHLFFLKEVSSNIEPRSL